MYDEGKVGGVSEPGDTKRAINQQNGWPGGKGVVVGWTGRTPWHYMLMLLWCSLDRVEVL
jgi:hypothetical protein